MLEFLAFYYFNDHSNSDTHREALRKGTVKLSSLESSEKRGFSYEVELN